MLKYVILIIGFILLIKGADFFVSGAASVAKKLSIPTIIVGMTVVAMGTSLPELAVSTVASFNGSNEMAYSNVVGSNFFNILVVIGACALFAPVVVHKKTMKKEFPFSIIITVLLCALGMIGMKVGRVDGLIFVIIFIFFIVFMVKSALDNRKAEKILSNNGAEDESEVQDNLPIWRCIIYIVGGAAAVAFGGEMVVNSASDIAVSFGMSQTLVGLTICSIGTSLPELVTSIAAARKKDVDMALGNAIGSNIFNILFVLGIASVVRDVAVTSQNIIDVILLTAVNIVVWIFCRTKWKIDRFEGIVMIAVYAVYMVYICIR